MPRTIRLSVPATLQHKSLLLCAASLAAQGSCDEAVARSLPLEQLLNLSDPFTSELVSAVSELANNIVLHGHRNSAGSMEFVFTVAEGYIEIEVRESGVPFDISMVSSPNLDELPEGGMGLYIVRSYVDELWYEPGDTNVWSLVKYRSAAAARERRRDMRAASGRIEILPNAEVPALAEDRQPSVGRQ